MKQSIYLTTHGILARKDNTLLYINEEEKTPIPFAQIRDIHAFGKISVRSGVVDLLAEHSIPLHHYNKYRMHVSSLLPRSDLTSGKLLVEQVKTYLNPARRGEIASAIIEAMRENMISNLQYYRRKGRNIDMQIEQMQEVTIPQEDTNTVLGAEARIWKIYYSCFSEICPGLPFGYRSYRPPHNEMNALLSLTNMMTYTSVLSMILQTYLHPSISFLHEPRERRYSLSLDLAEYFKPIIGHRVIFTLVNQKQITPQSFENVSGIKLKDSVFKLVLKEFQEKLNATYRNKRLKRKISYRQQIKVDAHKLVKVILEGKKFTPFVV